MRVPMHASRKRLTCRPLCWSQWETRKCANDTIYTSNWEDESDLAKLPHSIAERHLSAHAHNQIRLGKVDTAHTNLWITQYYTHRRVAVTWNEIIPITLEIITSSCNLVFETELMLAIPVRFFLNFMITVCVLNINAVHVKKYGQMFSCNAIDNYISKDSEL